MAWDIQFDDLFFTEAASFETAVRADLLLSTMSSYIEAMGGKLKLVAEFPDRNPVVIKNLSDIAVGEKRASADTL